MKKIILFCGVLYMGSTYAISPKTVDKVHLLPQQPFLNIHTPNNVSEINIGFTGKDLTIYGTTNIKGNIIVVIRSDNTIYTLNKKVKKSIFWLDQKVTDTIIAPQFYAMNTLYFLRDGIHKKYPYMDIGISYIAHGISRISPIFSMDEKQVWKTFTRLKKYNNSYQTDPVGITQLSPYLFETTVHIPSDMSPGVYTISAFVDDAPTYQYTPTQIVASDSKSVYIGRSNLIKFIYSSARDYSSLYGIIAILCSLGIGLGVGFMRRRR